MLTGPWSATTNSTGLTGEVQPNAKHLHTAVRFERDDQSSRQSSAVAVCAAEGCKMDYRKKNYVKCSQNSKKNRKGVAAGHNRLSIGLLKHGAETFLVYIDVLQAPTVEKYFSFSMLGKPNLQLQRIYEKMVPLICFGICCIRKQNETRKFLTSTCTLIAENRTVLINYGSVENMKHATCLFHQLSPISCKKWMRNSFERAGISLEKVRAWLMTYEVLHMKYSFDT